ncbi:MAG: hypothetical protein IH612_09830 [Desulfofustis sp.]|nr:hypothetical protein [Desulfofustis sp.]
MFLLELSCLLMPALIAGLTTAMASGKVAEAIVNAVALCDGNSNGQLHGHTFLQPVGGLQFRYPPQVTKRTGFYGARRNENSDPPLTFVRMPAVNKGEILFN